LIIDYYQLIVATPMENGKIWGTQNHTDNPFQT